MNRNFTFKGLGFFLFFLSFSSFSFACINSVTIVTNSSNDNGDGTCTYDISITVDHTSSAAAIDLEAIGGSFDSCDEGACDDISASPTGLTTINAFVTKNCVDEIDIIARGKSGGLGCGSLGVRFTGEGGLPAELISFHSAQNERTNTLMWKTASEDNTMAFLIQRSIDGTSNFEVVGRVEAIGNSFAEQEYSFVDENPLTIAYYRLQTIDVDGSFEFSDLIIVERIRTEVELVEILPNPVVGNDVNVLIHSKVGGTVFVDLFDMTGKVLKQDRIDLVTGVNKLQIDLQNSEGNVYFLTIYNGSERISKTILKTNLD